MEYYLILCRDRLEGICIFERIHCFGEDEDKYPTQSGEEELKSTLDELINHNNNFSAPSLRVLRQERDWLLKSIEQRIHVIMMFYLSKYTFSL